MTFTVGRFALDGGTYLQQVKDSASQIAVTGYMSVADLDAVEVLRQQLLGYVALADEQFVPVTWDENPQVDGYYKVLAVDVTTEPGSEVNGYATFACTLERVLSFASPLMELQVLGAVRATESQVVTNYFKNPNFDGAGAPVNESGMTSVGIVSDGGNNVAAGTTTGTGTSAIRLSANADRPAASAGQRWYGAASIKNPNAGSRLCWLALRFYDTAGATLGTAVATFTSPTVTVGAGVTTGFLIDGTAPVGTASVGLFAARAAGGGAATSDLLYVDAVYLSTDPLFIDVGVFSGASTPRSGYAFAWTSTANASTSTCTMTWTSSTAIPQAGLPSDLESLQNVTVPGGLASTPAMKEFTTAAAAVRTFEPPAGESVTEFRVPPADFYDGAATLLIGGHVAVGRQVVNDPDGWLLSNDRFQVRPVAGELAVEMRQYTSGAWSDWQTVAFRMQPDTIDGVSWLGIAAFADPHAVTVLRNSPECVAIRLHSKLAFQTVSLPVSYYELTVSVDLLLRRGMPYAAVEMKASVPGKLGVAVEGFSAASPFNHGWFLASSSVFAASPQAIVMDGSTPAGVKTSSSLTSASFGVGFTSTPLSFSGPSRYAYADRHYQFATAERMRVVS